MIILSFVNAKYKKHVNIIDRTVVRYYNCFYRTLVLFLKGMIYMFAGLSKKDFVQSLLGATGIFIFAYFLSALLLGIR